MPAISQKVRDLREAGGISRERLAAEAGVSLSTISRLELQNSIPNGLVLVRIARVLGVTVEDLVPDEPVSA